MNEDYFINIISSVPDHKLIPGRWTDGNGGFCTLGLFGVRGQVCPDVHPEATALMELVPNIRGINDGDSEVYKQDTPKQRVLAALLDVKINNVLNSVSNNPKNIHNYDLTKVA